MSNSNDAAPLFAPEIVFDPEAVLAPAPDSWGTVVDRAGSIARSGATSPCDVGAIMFGDPEADLNHQQHHPTDVSGGGLLLLEATEMVSPLDAVPADSSEQATPAGGVLTPTAAAARRALRRSEQQLESERHRELQAAEATRRGLRNLFIAWLPPSYTDSDLLHLAHSVGPVQSCRVVHDERRSYGFILFEDSAHAAAAVTQLGRHVIQGRRLQVHLSKKGSVVNSGPSGGPLSAGASPQSSNATPIGAPPMLTSPHHVVTGPAYFPAPPPMPMQPLQQHNLPTGHPQQHLGYPMWAPQPMAPPQPQQHAYHMPPQHGGFTLQHHVALPPPTPPPPQTWAPAPQPAPAWLTNSNGAFPVHMPGPPPSAPGQQTQLIFTAAGPSPVAYPVYHGMQTVATSGPNPPVMYSGHWQ